MTEITKNLPFFIREPAVALIGEKCYKSLVEELHFGDVDCLKYALSKGLGLGIVVGGSIVKVPQVIIILASRSAKGLSLLSYVLETAAYAITLAYSQRNGFPFSTYGENLFLTLQNSLITILIVFYPASGLRHAPNNTSSALTTLVVLLAGFYALYIVPGNTLAMLQVLTLPLSVFSKLPQIASNYRAKSTGQLSAFAVIAQIAGCLARLFTTATEVGDAILFGGFAVALVLNMIVGLQLWIYWDSEKDKDTIGTSMKDLEEKTRDEKRDWPRDRVEVVVPAPIPGQRVSSPAPGRRWSRKVD